MGWLGAALGIASAIMGSDGEEESGKEQERVAREQAKDYAWNAKMDKKREKDVKKRGAFESELMARQTEQLIGRQRAAMGASGVIADAGTFADVLDDTEAAGLQDQNTILQNAMREAYGYSQSAKNWRRKARETRRAGEAAKDSADANSTGSLISGVIGAGSSMGWW